MDNNKKAWNTPALVNFGSVQELTQQQPTPTIVPVCNFKVVAGNDGARVGQTIIGNDPQRCSGV